MKTKLKTIGLCLLIATSTVLIDACKGKDGEPGAQGPAGTNGNANVIGSNSVTTSSWTLTGGVLYSTTLTWTAITQDVVDKGVVMVYESDGSGGWSPLPYSIVSENHHFGFDVGFVNIYVSNADGSTPSHPGSRTYRTIAMTSRQLQEHPNLDLTKYNEVKVALKLRD